MWLQEGIIDKQFDRGSSMPPMPEDHPMMEGFFKILKSFETAVRGYGDCDVYADKISRWNRMKLVNLFIDVAKPMRGGFQILNHGDTWLNNMMFKFDDDNNPIDVSMIDYQMSFWGTPSADFLYFFVTSVADDIKVTHFDDLVEHYHEQLSSALKKLNYDQHIPTLWEIQTDLLDGGGYGLCKNKNQNIFGSHLMDYFFHQQHAHC